MIQRGLLRQLRTASVRSYCPHTSWKSGSLRLPTQLSSLQQRIAPRCYSTTPETQESKPSDPPVSEKLKPEAVNESSLQRDLEAKSREIIDLKDKYLRSVAEFRNLQERTKRDIDTARSFAITRFASDLVESIDNLDRALGTVSSEKLSQSYDNKELVNLHEGLKMTETILMQTLKKHGLERFDPSINGDAFDPRYHEATFQTKVEGKEEGSVFTTQQKGFLLNGRVVRAAKVGVVKNS